MRFTDPMPPVTQRAHFTPQAGDSVSALVKVGRMRPGPDGVRAVDVNFQLVDGTPVAIHWSTPGRNGYDRFINDAGVEQDMTPEQRRRPAEKWGLRGVLSWRRPNGDRPLTYAEAVELAVNLDVVICAELKSPGFADVNVMRGMVDAARAAGHPPWFMALLKMKNAKGKAISTARAGGSFALIFGKFRSTTKRPPADWDEWRHAVARVWGPPNTRKWVDGIPVTEDTDQTPHLRRRKRRRLRKRDRRKRRRHPKARRRRLRRRRRRNRR